MIKLFLQGLGIGYLAHLTKQRNKFSPFYYSMHYDFLVQSKHRILSFSNMDVCFLVNPLHIN